MEIVRNLEGIGKVLRKKRYSHKSRLDLEKYIYMEKNCETERNVMNVKENLSASDRRAWQ